MPQAPRRGVTIGRAPALTLLVLCIVLLSPCSSGGTTRQAGLATPAATSAGAATVSTASAPPAAYPFTLSGTDGSAVTLTKAPARIVSLSPGSTEILFAIGAGQSVAAADKFSDFPEAAKDLPKVEYTRPSVESLAGFHPDLIIGATRQKDIVAAVQNADLPIVLLEEPDTVAGVIVRVRLLGRATGHSAAAEQLAAQMEVRIRAVTEKLSGVTQGPAVFHEISFAAGAYTATPRSFVGDLYTLLKARNVAEGAAGAFPQLSQEAIIQADPEVIVLADGREGVTVDQVRARPGWSAISAVKSGRIYLLTDTQADITSRPGPRVVDALEQLAKLLYPDRF